MTGLDILLRSPGWDDAPLRLRWAAVHRYVRRHLWHSSDAEDLTQNVFLTAWRKRDTVTDQHLGWLIGVAFNHIRDYRRTMSIKASRHVFADDDAIERAPAPHDLYAAVLAREQIAQIFTLLPARDVNVLRLHYLQDMPQVQAAAVLGVSQAHMGRLLSRALERAHAIAVALDIAPSPDLTPAPAPTSDASLSVEMRLLLAERYLPAMEYLPSHTHPDHPRRRRQAV